jgi:hypothetical protein
MLAIQDREVRKFHLDQFLAPIAMHMSWRMIAGMNHDSKSSLLNDRRHRTQDKGNESDGKHGS